MQHFYVVTVLFYFEKNQALLEALLTSATSCRPTDVLNVLNSELNVLNVLTSEDQLYRIIIKSIIFMNKLTYYRNSKKKKQLISKTGNQVFSAG